MIDQAKVDSAVKELKELKELFEKIKKDSEELFARGKALSETGTSEAHELIDAAKANWSKVISNFSTGGGLASLLTSAIKTTKATLKKKSVPAKKAKATSKKTSSKKAKKKSSKK